MESLFLFAIFVAILNNADAQIGVPQIISLLNSVNDTSTTMANSQQVNQAQTTTILKHLANSLGSLEANFNQTTAETTMILSQLANAQTQMASTQAQIVSNQAQMTSTLDQVVLIMQGKKIILHWIQDNE